VPLPSIPTAKLTIKREPFDHPNWLYELKYDGFRSLVYFENGTVRLVSRNGNVYTRFQALCESISKVLRMHNAIQDGEIVCLDDKGRPRFYDLMLRCGAPVFAAFDILWVNGRDLRQNPLTERKKRLRHIIPSAVVSQKYVHPTPALIESAFARLETYNASKTAANNRRSNPLRECDNFHYSGAQMERAPDAECP
jgi:ATP-dependent DNA ligase